MTTRTVLLPDVSRWSQRRQNDPFLPFGLHAPKRPLLREEPSFTEFRSRENMKNCLNHRRQEDMFRTF
jgi:hypothetical protein